MLVFHNLWRTINLAFSNQIDIQEFEAILFSYGEFLISPLNYPIKNQNDRKKVADGNVTIGPNSKKMNETLIRQALEISDTLNLNEIMSVELLQLAIENKLKYGEKLNETEVAVTIFHIERHHLLFSLLQIARYPQRKIAQNLQASLSQFINHLIRNNIVENLINKLKELYQLLHKEPNRNEFIINEMVVISDIVLNLSFFHHVPTKNIVDIYNFLQEFSTQMIIEKQKENQQQNLANQEPIIKKNRNHLTQIMFSFTFGAICKFAKGLAEVVSKLEDPNFDSEKTPLLNINSGEFLQELSRVFKPKPEWQHKQIHGVLSFGLGIFIYTIDNLFDENQNTIYNVDDLLLTSLESKVFEFFVEILEHKLSIFSYSSTPEIYVQILDELIYFLIVGAPQLVSSIRMNEIENERELVSYRNNPRGVEPVSVRDDYQQLLRLVATLYYQKPTLSYKFFFRPLRDFLQESCQFLTSKLFISVVNMFASLVNDEQCAEQAYNFLGSNTNQLFNWLNFFNVIEKYRDELSEYNQRSQTRSIKEIRPEDIEALIGMQRLITRIVANYEIGRIELVQNSRWGTLHSLVGLLSCRIPSKLKSALLGTISAFCKTPQIALNVWEMIEESQLLQTSEFPKQHTILKQQDKKEQNQNFPDSDQNKTENLAQQTQILQKEGILFERVKAAEKKVTSGFQIQLEQVESRNKEYPELISFLNLIYTLLRNAEVPEQLGKNNRRVGVMPYIEFIVKQVFFQFSQRSYLKTEEKWIVSSLCLKIFYICLLKYSASAEDFSRSVAPKQEPGFYLMKSILSGKTLLKTMKFIVEYGVKNLEDLRLILNDSVSNAPRERNKDDEEDTRINTVSIEKDSGKRNSDGKDKSLLGSTVETKNAVAFFLEESVVLALQIFALVMKHQRNFLALNRQQPVPLAVKSLGQLLVRSLTSIADLFSLVVYPFSTSINNASLSVLSQLGLSSFSTVPQSSIIEFLIRSKMQIISGFANQLEAELDPDDDPQLPQTYLGYSQSDLFTQIPFAYHFLIRDPIFFDRSLLVQTFSLSTYNLIDQRLLHEVVDEWIDNVLANQRIHKNAIQDAKQSEPGLETKENKTEISKSEKNDQEKNIISSNKDLFEYLPSSISCLKESIVKFLLDSLAAPAPNFAHYLLGFDVSKDIKNTRLDDKKITSLNSIFSIMETPGFAQRFPRLSQLCYELIFKLCTDKETSKTMINFLRSKTGKKEFLLSRAKADLLSTTTSRRIVSERERYQKETMLGGNIIGDNGEVTEHEPFSHERDIINANLLLYRLYQKSWLLRTLALEMRRSNPQLNPLRPRAKQTLALLLGMGVSENSWENITGKETQENIEDPFRPNEKKGDHQFREEYSGGVTEEPVFEQNEIKMLQLLDEIELPNKSLKSTWPIESRMFSLSPEDPQLIFMTQLGRKHQVAVLDVEKISLSLVQQYHDIIINQQGIMRFGPDDVSPEIYSEDELRAEMNRLVRNAILENKSIKLAQAQFHFLESWRHMVFVAVSEILPVDINQDPPLQIGPPSRLLFSLGNSLLRKLQNADLHISIRTKMAEMTMFLTDKIASLISSKIPLKTPQTNLFSFPKDNNNEEDSHNENFLLNSKLFSPSFLSNTANPNTLTLPQARSSLPLHLLYQQTTQSLKFISAKVPIEMFHPFADLLFKCAIREDIGTQIRGNLYTAMTRHIACAEVFDSLALQTELLSSLDNDTSENTDFEEKISFEEKFLPDNKSRIRDIFSGIKQTNTIDIFGDVFEKLRSFSGQNLQIVQKYTAKIVDVLCQDIIYNDNIWKCTAFSTLETLLGIEQQGMVRSEEERVAFAVRSDLAVEKSGNSLLDLVDSRGYLRVIVEEIEQSETALSNVLTLRSSSLNALFIAESRFSLLSSVALTKKGSKMLMENGILELLCYHAKYIDDWPEAPSHLASIFFPSLISAKLPEQGIPDLPAFPQNIGEQLAAYRWIEDKTDKYHKLLAPALRLLFAMCSSVPHNTDLAGRMLDFIVVHQEVIGRILEDRGILITPRSLSELFCVTGIIRYLASSHLLVLVDKLANFFDLLRDLSLKLFQKYHDPRRWIGFVDIEQIKRNQVDQVFIVSAEIQVFESVQDAKLIVGKILGNILSFLTTISHKHVSHQLRFQLLTLHQQITEESPDFFDEFIQHDQPYTETQELYNKLENIFTKLNSCSSLFVPHNPSQVALETQYSASFSHLFNFLQISANFLTEYSQQPHIHSHSPRLSSPQEDLLSISTFNVEHGLLLFWRNAAYFLDDQNIFSQSKFVPSHSLQYSSEKQNSETQNLPESLSLLLKSPQTKQLLQQIGEKDVISLFTSPKYRRFNISD
ncbi:nuclear pore complex protein nup205 [Anaeramoeba ignava]|uniref:Nuclear pore complex protein nup205 n=1 Tax=Anaeramoeba ignava TaxID=1746090 RepID=A0A9Q0LQB7_ANAIG|nr:nuclear pore complex protein nup205 [Anaeramoeba ignava]